MWTSEILVRIEQHLMPHRNFRSFFATKLNFVLLLIMELSEFSDERLERLLENQRKLLLDTKLIQNLPDKGNKIRSKISQIELILRTRSNMVNPEKKV